MSVTRDRQCVICGAPLRTSALHTCSRRCMAIWQTKPVEHRVCACEGCGVVFTVGGRGRASRDKRFCSHKCAAGVTNRLRVTSTGRRTVSCPTCSASHTGEGRFCSRKCYDLSRRSGPFESVGWELKRARVIDEQCGRCAACGLATWGGEPIPLQIDHEDGDNENDARENLRALCPNCHSVTPTWRGRNVRFQVTDVELMMAVVAAPNIAQALRRVGLVPKGGNYIRAKRLLAEHHAT